MDADPYEALVAAARQLDDATAILNAAVLDVSAASDYLQRNRMALELARRTLSSECRVPLRYEREFFCRHSDDFSELRKLARVFQAEFRVAVSGGDLPGAARVGINILDLANAIRRGGLEVDLLVGVAVEGIGSDAIGRVRADYDRDTRRFLIAQLGRIDREREPFAVYAAREEMWKQLVADQDEPFDWTTMEVSDPEECGLSDEQQREIFALVQWFSEQPKNATGKLILENDRRGLALVRLLAVDLALREWHAEVGAFPDDLARLTPGLLSELVLDPFTGRLGR